MSKKTQREALELKEYFIQELTGSEYFNTAAIKIEQDKKESLFVYDKESLIKTPVVLESDFWSLWKELAQANLAVIQFGLYHDSLSKSDYVKGFVELFKDVLIVINETAEDNIDLPYYETTTGKRYEISLKDFAYWANYSDNKIKSTLSKKDVSLNEYLELASLALRVNDNIMNRTGWGESVGSEVSLPLSTLRTEELAWFAYFNKVIQAESNVVVKEKYQKELNKNIDNLTPIVFEQIIRKHINKYQKELGLIVPFTGPARSLKYDRVVDKNLPAVIGFIENRYVIVIADKIFDCERLESIEVLAPLHVVISEERTVDYFNNKAKKSKNQKIIERGTKDFNERMMLEFSSADWLIFRQMKKNLPKNEMVGGFVRCDSLLTYLNEISRINKVKNNDWLRNLYIEQVEIDMVHGCDLGTLGPAINYLFNDQSQSYSMSDRKKDYEIKEINGEYAFLANGESLTNRFIELSQKINQVDRYSYQVYDEITYKEKEVSPEHMSMIGNIMLSAHNLNNRGVAIVSDNFNAGKHESLNSGGGVSVSDTKLHLRNIIQNRKEVLKADKPQKIFEIKDYYAISQSFEDAYVVNVIAELISCLEDGVVNGDQFEEISKYFYPSLRDLKNKSFCGLVPIIYRAIHEEWMKNNSNY